MAVIGIITNEGLEKTREALANRGWKIYPTGFGVSETAGALDVSRDIGSINPEFYSGLVASGVAIGVDTVRILCTIPSSQAVGQTHIREIYVYAKDIDDNDFLFAVAQPENTLLYDPDGETTLRLQFKINNADLSSSFLFSYTQTSEVNDHNQDPNAHPDIRSLLELAGLYEQQSEHSFVGQAFDPYPTFDPSVVQNDLVYKDTDDVYKPAIVDGTIKETVIGIADVARDVVISDNYISITSGHPHGSILYLSPDDAGKYTIHPERSGIPIGHVVDDETILLRVWPKINTQYWDAIVSDIPGYKHHAVLQDAINDIPDNGWIRVDSFSPVKSLVPITNSGKVINVQFTGMNSGIYKFGGTDEEQLLEFSAIPDAGQFKLVHDGNKTGFLDFNATPAQIKTELELLASISEVNVTGDFTNGFTVVFINASGKQDQLLIEPGTFVGEDEVQRIAFSAVPDEGTFRLAYNAEITGPIAWDEGAAEIEGALNALPSLSEITVSGTFATDFIVTFAGVDGKKPHVQLAENSNSLLESLSPVTMTPTTDTEGLYPDVWLTNAGSLVVVSPTVVIEGELPGSSTGLLLDSSNCNLIGIGRFLDFSLGLDLNSQVNTRFEIFFDNCTTPVDHSGLTYPGDFNFDGSLGFNIEDVGGLVLVEEETRYRNLVKATLTEPLSTVVDVSSAEEILGDGSRHGINIDNVISTYAGGSIDFATGIVTGAGDDFTPYVALTPGNYYKYVVVLLKNHGIKVIQPTGEAGSLSGAPVPPIDEGLIRAEVTIKDDGAGGITVIDPSQLKNFFDIGAYVKELQRKEYHDVGGSSVYDVAPMFEFDSSNSIYDIEVYVNGERQIQDTSGGLDEDYRKISSTQIEFSKDGSAYNVPSFIQIKEVKRYVSTGGSSIYDTALDFEFDASNTVFDIKVQINGAEQFQDSTGGLTKDYRKISTSEIEFSYTIPTGAVVEVFFTDTIDTTDPVDVSVIFRDPTVDSHVTGVAEASFKVARFLGVGTQSVFLCTDFNFSTDNAIEDIEVYVNGDRIWQDITGGLNEDYRKISNNEIELSFNLPTDAKLMVVQRMFSIGNIASGSTFSFKDEGVLLSNNVSEVNAVGPNLEAVETSPGAIELRYLEASFQNQGTGQGDVFKELLPDRTVNLRKIKAGIGISVIQIADDIIINLATSVYFVNYVEGISGLSVPVGNIYDIATSKLAVFRNGVASVLSASQGSPEERYSELSNTAIGLSEDATINDIFAFINDDVAPNYRQIISGETGSTLTVQNYTLGTDQLMVFRNGILMNSANQGIDAFKYSETDANTITLELDAQTIDTFIILNLGSVPNFREDKTTLVGSVINLTGTYTQGDEKLWVFRNGNLIYNTTSLGDAWERYQETGPQQITLAQGAQTTDLFTFINR